MDVNAMIRHYRKIFGNNKDIFDWIVHDLKHMGLKDLEYKQTIKELKDTLKLET